LSAELVREGGLGCVSAQPDRRALFSQDIWCEAEYTTALIVAPESTEQLARLVRVITAHGFAIAPRGGGMSYTGGYLPQGPRTVTVDFSRMNKILAVREADMTVTVESGCTWMALYQELKGRGLRTPFWGPLSGFSSTIGGGLSQLNAIFGSGCYGTTSESVVGVTVVLAEGRVLRTGAGGESPFYRHYGPDLTGIFCGDSGCFGLKAEITLRLMRLPAHEAHASFAFATRAHCVAAAAQLARSGLACESFGFDPNLARVRLRRASLRNDLQVLSAVASAGKSKLRGAVAAAKIALSGRDFVGEADYSLHVVCEGRSAAAVAADLAALRALVHDSHGVEIANTIPQVLRAHPFTPLNNILGPDGERWVPVHGIVALSQADAACAALEAVFAQYAEECTALGVHHGFMYTTLSTNAFLIEPVFFWPESHLAIHRATVEADFMARMPAPRPRAGASDLVRRMRRRIIDVFEGFSAAHFQIGRTYGYRRSRDAPSLELLDAIKRTLDPQHLINPGALERE
jgi:FAD/FMN-containing dehydrogenase